MSIICLVTFLIIKMDDRQFMKFDKMFVEVHFHFSLLVDVNIFMKNHMQYAVYHAYKFFSPKTFWIFLYQQYICN